MIAMNRAPGLTFLRTAMLTGVALLVAGCDRSDSAERSTPKTVLRAAIPDAGQAGPTDLDAAASTLPPGPGIYGDVALQNGSGAMSGTEVEIHAGPDRTIDFTLCETGCNTVRRTQYGVDGNALTASYSEPQENGLGQTLPPLPRNFRLTRHGADIAIEGEWLLGGTAVLKRLPTRYGLRAAEEREKETALLTRR